MATYSSRMALVKPAGSEQRSVVPLNANTDLLDKFMPCILVNDGVTPPTGDLYDGALVKEKTSGIIWEARKNGGGTFDKYYVQYPLLFVGDSQFPNFPSGTVGQPIGFANISAECVNSGAGNVSNGYFVVPVTGIWHLVLYNRWDINSTGYRAIRLHLNGSAVFTDSPENIWVPPAGIGCNVSISITRKLTKNDQIAINPWQNSGGNLLLGLSKMWAHLITPVGPA